MPTITTVALTLLRKAGDALSKRIWLDKKGNVVSNGDECRMAEGTAERVHLNDVAAFGQLIDNMQSDEGLALGALRADLPDKVDVVTKRKLSQVNGTPGPNLITRTRDYILYTPGQAAAVLLDYDPKGASPAIVQQVKENGLWPTLVAAIPELAGAARVQRASTSAGLYRSDTGVKFLSSGGQHIYLFIKDGTDTPRLLGVIHERLWLAGFGWCIVSDGGQPLERSLIDRSVGWSERIVFEGARCWCRPCNRICSSAAPAPMPAR
jgi:hypothetical protein